MNNSDEKNTKFHRKKYVLEKHTKYLQQYKKKLGKKRINKTDIL